MKTEKELMLEWYERVWKQNDENAISELMAPNCIVHGLGIPVIGPDQFAEFHDNFIQAFRDPWVEVFELVEADSVTLGHATFRAIHSPTDRNIEFVFSFSVKWVNGQAVEARNVVDFTSMLAQIGAFNPNILVESLKPAAAN